MKLNPYLSFNGQCEAAFKLYEECLGGKITFMTTFGDSPMAEQTPPDWHKKIMHVTLALGDGVLQGSDVTRRAIRNRRASPCRSSWPIRRRRSASSRL